MINELQCDEINKWPYEPQKSAFCIYENNGADQLQGNHAANQRLCFGYIAQSFYFLNLKFHVSRNPEDRFSCDAAHYAQMNDSDQLQAST